MNEQRRPTALIAGSVLVASLSSACCWLPLLAVALGFSAVGIGSAFETYRWPMLVVALGLVGTALVLQRRARRACSAEGCRPPSGRSLAWPVAGGVLVLVFAAFPELVAWSKARSTTEAPTEGVHETYLVEGMTCEGCTGLLVSYLEDQPEIVAATVSFEQGTARVEFLAGTSVATANDVMARVTKDWEGKYEFSSAPRP